MALVVQGVAVHGEGEHPVDDGGLVLWLVLVDLYSPGVNI
jgi:hypothetical protein